MISRENNLFGRTSFISDTYRGGVQQRDHQQFGLPLEEGMKVRLARTGKASLVRSDEVSGKCIIDFPCYRYRQVLFAPSDTYGWFLLFYVSDARRSVRKYCSNDGFLGSGRARSPPARGGAIRRLEQDHGKNDRR